MAIMSNGYGSVTVDSTDQALLGLVPGTNFNRVFSVYASGTPYSLTASASGLVFGTTSPNLTISASGTYLISGRASLKYNGATFAVAKTATIKLTRTNNTVVDLANAVTVSQLGVVTLLTNSAGNAIIPPTIYTTNNTNDSISIYGSLSGLPSIGTVDITEAEIISLKLY